MLRPPAARPSADALRANPAARVLTGTLLTAAPPARQTTLSFGAPPPPREVDGVIELLDSDDDDGARAPRLPTGVVLLRGFLSLADQHALLAAVDSVTATVPFTIPEVKHPFTGEPAFANLYMSHAGRTWDGTRASYFAAGAGASRFTNLLTNESVAVPPVPRDVVAFARAAVAEALRREPGVFEAPPLDVPDALTVVQNFYASWSSISPHSDGSEPSLKDGKSWPVVSLSVGDTAVFTLYPHATTAPGAHTENGAGLDVLLQSGDVLLFGGAARMIRHAVTAVKAVGAGGVARPAGLRMVPGRLNVTLRAL